MVTIKELEEEIAERKKKLIKAKQKEILEIRKRELQRGLIRIKSRKAIAAGQKAKRLLGKAGKGILAAGKKIVPVLKKHARLIREQQLRDDAKRRTAPTTIKKVITVKKRKGKRTKVTVKTSKKRPKKQRRVSGGGLLNEGVSLFGDLDF